MFDMNQHREAMRQYRESICREPSYKYYPDELRLSPDEVYPLKLSAVVKVLTCVHNPPTTLYQNMEDEHTRIMSSKSCLDITGLGLSMSVFPVTIMTNYFEIDSLEEFKSMYKPDSIFLVKGDYHISEDSNVFIIGPDVTLLPPETAANMDMQFNKYILSKTNG